MNDIIERCLNKEVKLSINDTIFVIIIFFIIQNIYRILNNEIIIGAIILSIIYSLSLFLSLNISKKISKIFLIMLIINFILSLIISLFLFNVMIIGDNTSSSIGDNIIIHSGNMTDHGYLLFFTEYIFLYLLFLIIIFIYKLRKKSDRK